MDAVQLAIAAVVIVVAYLIGGIPWGVVIARVTGGPDPRTIGSGRTGGANVMREQLTYLIDRVSDSSDEVQIQVVPFDRGLYAHLRVGYVLLKLLVTDDGLESEPPVLYLEEALEQLVIHDERGNRGKSGRKDKIDLAQSLLEVIAVEQKPAEYSTVFDTVAHSYAAGPEETISLLKAAHSDMKD